MISAGTSGLIGLLFAAPYRMDRIIAFRDIWADPLGKGYQPIQSLTSIAAGGWLGVGLGGCLIAAFAIQLWSGRSQGFTERVAAGVLGAALVMGVISLGFGLAALVPG